MSAGTARMRRRTAVGVLLSCVLAVACTPRPLGAVESAAPAATAAAASPVRRLGAGEACPVSSTNALPPPEVNVPLGLFARPGWYANASLGLLAPADGVLRVRPSRDGLAQKLPWYRFATGRLTMTGRRLDAESPPAGADVPDGYGTSGFQSTQLTFPAPGCWEIAGSVGGDELRVVVRVESE